MTRHKLGVKHLAGLSDLELDLAYDALFDLDKDVWTRLEILDEKRRRQTLRGEFKWESSLSQKGKDA